MPWVSRVVAAALIRRVGTRQMAARRALFAQNQPVYRCVIHLRIVPVRKLVLKTFASATINIAAFHPIVSPVGTALRAAAPPKPLWVSSAARMMPVDRDIVLTDYAAMRCAMVTVWRASTLKPENLPAAVLL